MKTEQTKRNRLWMMAALAVVLFVALASVPVAAYDVIYMNPPILNNNSYIPVANPEDIAFDYTGIEGGYYYVNLTNTSTDAGAKAIHITNSTTNMAGTCYNFPTATSGTFYVGDTGGRHGQDDIILLVAVNSTEPGVVEDFKINITSSGYAWDPTDDGIPPEGLTDIDHLTVLNSKTFNSTSYLTNATYGTPLLQEWKFAPTADYPVYCGQTMGGNASLFKLIAIDLGVGTINGTWYNANYDPDLAYDNGLANITYTITSPSSFNSSTTKVAFNIYAYNNQTTQGQGINWINKVSTGSGKNGWLVGNP